MSNRFTENFVKQRRKMGITQQQAADRIGIKRSKVGSWEEGRGKPDYDTLIIISNVFETTIDQLLKEQIL